MEEIFRNINDYYSVSNFGNVKSLRTNKLLKPKNHTSGYLQVCLVINNKKEYKYIHRLVGKLFLEDFKEAFVINHKDCNKKNNNVSNLESVSQYENIKHSVYNNLNCKGDTHGRKKLTQLMVESIRKSENNDLFYLSQKYNVTKATISRILNNKIWKT